MRLWIDTDVGDDPDDAIALLCAAASPAVELVGVSTVDGDHEHRRALARALVDAPVYTGDDPRLGAAVRERAPEAFLAIGPLTNVAALLDAGIELPPLTVMGGVLGAVRHWGHRLEVEHNFGRDPAAARRALRGCDEPVVVPLNVTLQARLSSDELDRLVDAAPVIRPNVEGFLDLQGQLGVPGEDRAVFLHDPLALISLVEPTVLEVAERRVEVDPDGRLLDAVDGATTRLAVGVDAPRAVGLVLALVGADLG
ncbi:MAG TPA: nucleoside hydrolase [Acidimicrobiia bacterium]|nr:nucleoside hydrolase [Acidimicrobiia bacterium]